VPAVEVTRLLRGMQAQGWTWGHIGDLLGGVGGRAVGYMARKPGNWAKAETLTRVRAIAAEDRPVGPAHVRAFGRPFEHCYLVARGDG
jgi:hypothetical protein